MMKPIHCAWGIDLPGRARRGHRFTASAVSSVKLPDLNFYMHHSRLDDGGALWAGIHLPGRVRGQQEGCGVRPTLSSDTQAGLTLCWGPNRGEGTRGRVHRAARCPSPAQHQGGHVSYGLTMKLKPAVVIEISFLKIKYLSAKTSCAGSRKAVAGRQDGAAAAGGPRSGRFTRGSAGGADAMRCFVTVIPREAISFVSVRIKSRLWGQMEKLDPAPSSPEGVVFYHFFMTYQLEQEQT